MTPAKMWIGGAVLVLVMALVATIVLVSWRGHDRPAQVAPECRQPLVLTELVAPELESTIADLAVRFQSARRDASGCPLYSMLVYSATLGDTIRALHQQWSPQPTDLIAEGYFQPTRDVGPQPDGWIPGSSAEAWLAAPTGAQTGAQSGATTGPGTSSANAGAFPGIRIGVSLGWNQPVVAIPEGLLARLPTDAADRSWPWPALRSELRRHDIGLVRPNPAASSIGLLHTISLYKSMNFAAADIRQVETEINENIGRGGYPAGGEVELLCHQPSTPQHVAFLVSANTVRQATSQCPSTLYRPLTLSGVPALNYPYVELTWPGRGRVPAQRHDANLDFEHWLQNDPTAASALREATGGASGGIPDRVDTTRAWAEYLRQRASGRVLIAVDNSAPMAVSVSGRNEGSPLEGSAAAVRQALTLLGPADQVGVLTFAGRSGHDPKLTSLVDLGRLDDTRRTLLADLTISADHAAGQSPLYQVVDRGLHQLAASHPATATDVSALVVITAGDDLDSGESALVLQDRLTALGIGAGEIPVYVLAFNPDACADINNVLATTVGGACTHTQPDSVVGDLRDRLAGLWKGTDE